MNASKIAQNTVLESLFLGLWMFVEGLLVVRIVSVRDLMLDVFEK